MGVGFLGHTGRLLKELHNFQKAICAIYQLKLFFKSPAAKGERPSCFAHVCVCGCLLAKYEWFLIKLSERNLYNWLPFGQLDFRRLP